MARTTESTPTTAAAPTRSTRPRWVVPALVAGAAALGVVLWLTQPWLLFVDTVATETLPVTVEAGDEDGDPGGDAAVAGDAGASQEPTADDRMGGEQGQPDGAAQDAASDAPSPATAPSPTAAQSPAAAPTPTGPVVLATGEFISRDHGTSGRAALVRLEDGSRVLTIEDLDTDNGPDLFVYLDDDAADAPEGDFDDGLSLGRLRANQGDLVYEIPDDVDLSSVASVGIWCDRFSSLFGAADLVPIDA